MSDGSSEPVIDPRWPQLLSLSAHELRSPLSVVAGYIRMLLQQRAGPLSDDQLRLLQEAEKSCGRLSAVLAELSELARLESGTAPFNRSSVDLSSVLSDAISSLPALPDRDLTARLVDAPAIFIHGDAVRLKAAFSAILHALLRELVTEYRAHRASRRLPCTAAPDRRGSALPSRPGSKTSCSSNSQPSSPSMNGEAALALRSQSPGASLPHTARPSSVPPATPKRRPW